MNPFSWGTPKPNQGGAPAIQGEKIQKVTPISRLACLLSNTTCDRPFGFDGSTSLGVDEGGVDHFQIPEVTYTVIKYHSVLYYVRLCR